MDIAVALASRRKKRKVSRRQQLVCKKEGAVNLATKPQTPLAVALDKLEAANERIKKLEEALAQKVLKEIPIV